MPEEPRRQPRVNWQKLFFDKNGSARMDIDPSTTKYLIQARLATDGIVEKPDIVGAIFGQTEGLLGDELDLRDLQKSGRIGRIEVEVASTKGKSEGTVYVPSSLDQVETAILSEDTAIQGRTYKGGTQIHFYESGRVQMGHLAPGGDFIVLNEDGSIEPQR